VQGASETRPFANEGSLLGGHKLEIVELKDMPGSCLQRAAVAKAALEAGESVVEYLGHVLEEGDHDMYMMTALDELGEEKIEEMRLSQYCLDFWSENLRGDEDADSSENEGEGEGEGEGVGCNIFDMCNFLTRERYVIDARFCGSVARFVSHCLWSRPIITICGHITPRFYSPRFVNHSCDPNAAAQRWLAADGTLHIVFVAQRAIAAGEEVTIDYGWRNEAMVCHCGAAQCRGHL
jgi:hypothetical protein